MAEYKVLIYGLGEQYNRNFNIIRYFDMTGQFRMIGVTARHTPDAVKLDGYPVIKYEEICKSGFDFIVVMSDIYFREIVDDRRGLGSAAAVSYHTGYCRYRPLTLNGTLHSGTVISASFPITAGAERSAIRWE